MLNLKISNMSKIISSKRMSGENQFMNTISYQDENRTVDQEHARMMQTMQSGQPMMSLKPPKSTKNASKRSMNPPSFFDQT